MFWRPISAPGSTKSCARCAHDIAQALDALDTADIRRMRGLMVWFAVELAPLRGDAASQPSSGSVPLNVPYLDRRRGTRQPDALGRYAVP